ncbi:MAG: hypothetical protein QW660_09155 [Candidatus Bathyarchaeia archaeon]
MYSVVRYIASPRCSVGGGQVRDTFHRDLYANNHADVKLDAELSRENLCGN